MATDFGKLEFSTSFKLLNAIPFDARSYFESYEEALAAAQSAVIVNTPLATSNYYIGQILTVVDPINKESKTYTITKDGTGKITLVNMPDKTEVTDLIHAVADTNTSVNVTTSNAASFRSIITHEIPDKQDYLDVYFARQGGDGEEPKERNGIANPYIIKRRYNKIKQLFDETDEELAQFRNDISALNDALQTPISKLYINEYTDNTYLFAGTFNYSQVADNTKGLWRYTLGGTADDITQVSSINGKLIKNCTEIKNIGDVLFVGGGPSGIGYSTDNGVTFSPTTKLDLDGNEVTTAEYCASIYYDESNTTYYAAFLTTGMYQSTDGIEWHAMAKASDITSINLDSINKVNNTLIATGKTGMYYYDNTASMWKTVEQFRGKQVYNTVVIPSIDKNYTDVMFTVVLKQRTFIWYSYDGINWKDAVMMPLPVSNKQGPYTVHKLTDTDIIVANWAEGNGNCNVLTNVHAKILQQAGKVSLAANETIDGQKTFAQTVKLTSQNALEISNGTKYLEKTYTLDGNNVVTETNPTLSNIARYNIAENTADIQVGIMKPTVKNPDTTNPEHFATSGEIHVASMADPFTNGSRSIVSIRDNTIAEHVVAKLDESKKVAITTEYASMEGNIPFTTDRTEFHKTEFVTRDYVTPVIEEYQAFEISSYTSQYTDSSDNTYDVTCGVVTLSSELAVADLSTGTHTFEITRGPITLTDLYDDGMLLVRIGHANNETIASGDNVGPFFAISTKHTYCKNGNVQTILANAWNTSIWNTTQGSTNKIRLTVNFTANNTITYTAVINDRVTITQVHPNIGASVYSLNYINLYHTTYSALDAVKLQTRYDINNVIHNYDDETIEGQKTFTQDVIIPETAYDTVSSAAVTKAYVDNIVWFDKTLIDATSANVALGNVNNCYYTEFTEPLFTGNYKLLFTFSQITNLAGIGGKAIFRLGCNKNNNNDFAFTITSTQIYISGSAATTFNSSYWNIEPGTTNTIELDISFTATNAKVILSINNNVIKDSNNNPVVTTITNAAAEKRKFRYFAIPADFSKNGYIANSEVSAMSVAINGLSYTDKQIMLYNEYNTADPTYVLSDKKLTVKNIVIGDTQTNDRYISLNNDGDFYIRNQSSGKNIVLTTDSGVIQSNSNIIIPATTDDTVSSAAVTKAYVDEQVIHYFDDTVCVLDGPTGTANKSGGLYGAVFNLLTFYSKSLSGRFKLTTLTMSSAIEASGSGYGGNNIYCRLYECDESTTVPATSGRYIATSQNSVTNAANLAMVYEFDNVVLDRSKTYAAVFCNKTTSDGVDTYTPIACRMAVYASSDITNGNACFDGISIDGNIATFSYTANATKTHPIKVDISGYEIESIFVDDTQVVMQSDYNETLAETTTYIDNVSARTDTLDTYIDSVSIRTDSLDTYIDNVSSYTDTINEKVNTVSGDVATLITFRVWED